MHLQCDSQLGMRRPYSIMRADKNAGQIDILYKVVGTGSSYLATRKSGDTIQCLGPIGNQFTLSENITHPLLLGGGVGIPPMVFFADELRTQKQIHPFVIMGSEIPFPFTAKPSNIVVPNIPNDVIATMPLLDDWGIASRLTSQQGYQGCYQGFVHELAEQWIQGLDEKTKQGVASIFLWSYSYAASRCRVCKKTLATLSIISRRTHGLCSRRLCWMRSALQRR